MRGGFRRPQIFLPFALRIALRVRCLKTKAGLGAGRSPGQLILSLAPERWHHLQRHMRSCNSSSWESEYVRNRALPEEEDLEWIGVAGAQRPLGGG